MDYLGYDIELGVVNLNINLDYIRIDNIDKKTIEKIRRWRNLPDIRKNMLNLSLIHI